MMRNLLRRVIFCLAILCGAWLTLAGDDPVTNGSEPRITIYLVNHGGHAGIVLPRNAIPDGFWPELESFPAGRYLEVGWGDRDYYQALDPHMGLALKAALLPTDSVLHIVGFKASVTAYFPHAEIIAVALPPGGFARLLKTIAASFATDADGRIVPLGPGLYGNGRFYLSGETYHLFNTCNVWTARVLSNAGLPLSPAFAIHVSDLMSQVREHGVTVQAGSLP